MNANEISNQLITLPSSLRIKVLTLPYESNAYTDRQEIAYPADGDVVRSKDGSIGIVVPSLIWSTKTACLVLWQRKPHEPSCFLRCDELTSEARRFLTRVDFDPRFDRQYVHDQLWKQFSFDKKSLLDRMFRIGSHIGLLSLDRLSEGCTVGNAQLVLQWANRAGFFDVDFEDGLRIFCRCVEVLAGG